MEIEHPYKSNYSDLSKGVQNKVVLITGAASGIGRSATIEYLKLGAKVAACDINLSRLQSLAEELSNPTDLLIAKVDVTEYDEQYNFFTAAVEKYGRIDVVCANAGINPSAEFMNPNLPANVKPDLKVVDVNLTSVLYTSHLAVRYFRENTVAKEGEKCLILTGSIASFHALPATGMPYSAGKAAILSLTQSLSLQGQVEGFRCNCINPWFADTNILNKSMRMILKGLPLASVDIVSQAFILATATDATDQAWVIDEHGLWTLPNPAIKSQTLTHSRSPSPNSPEPPKKKTKVENKPFESVDYSNGLHLAPMVRSGTLPTRLVSLEYGAKLVWTPEVIDKAIIGSHRVYNAKTGVIDYIKESENKPVWSTHALERPHVIYQIGSSTPELAVEAAKTIEQDVAGIDLNCGCPKHFSVHAGMGAALLTNPDNLVAILNALCEALPHKSISCKIRMLSTQEETIKLIERICSTPIKAITIHCRTKSMRPSEPAQHDRLVEIREAIEKLRPDVAVVCNGDGTNYKQAQDIMKKTGVNAVMIARGAEANPTCFSKDGPVKIGAYWLQVAHAIENIFPATKFCTGQFTPFAKYGQIRKKDRAQLNQAISQAKSNEQLAEAYQITLTNEKGLDGEMFENMRKVIERRKSVL
ncbi:FMN-linked oxidoreductase [Wallemia mellicola]|nr:FMN-linked oxidoreductase [Wallemia mellicola]